MNLFQISPCVIVIFAAVTEPSISFYFKTSVLSHYLLDDSHMGMNLLRTAGEQEFQSRRFIALNGNNAQQTTKTFVLFSSQLFILYEAPGN